MSTAYDIALYLSGRYECLFGEQIGEMKLHKLLYLAQRESIIRYDQPLFNDKFQGWRFGPVLPGIRYSFQDIINKRQTSKALDNNTVEIIEAILQMYGKKDPWSLSRLSHGEYSWQQSRKGMSEYDNGYIPIQVEDIRVDAERIKERRKMLETI